MNIIETFDLGKKYSDTLAVNKVSMHVNEGEIYGFLGLNGAGKTTMIRLLLGMIKPTHGSCLLFGEKPGQAAQLWNDVGYLVETPYSYPNLSVIENLQVICKLRGLADKNLIPHIIEKLYLQHYQHKKEQHLSMGNKQRLGLAKALIHKPKLLILDEPINGLDPVGIVEIREFLRDLAKNHGTTIFLSSHILSEIAKITSRIGIIHNGILIKEINSQELEQQIIKKLHIATVDNRKALAVLKQKGFTAELADEANIRVTDAKALQHPEALATLLVNAQLPPKLLHTIEEDLESYFLRIIEEEK